MSPVDMTTKELYNEAEVILLLWTKVVRHSENTLQLRVSDGWKSQFNMLRVAVNKGDTVAIRSLIIGIAEALAKAAANPKIMESNTEFAMEMIK